MKIIIMKNILIFIGVLLVLFFTYSYIWLVVRIIYNNGIHTSEFLFYDTFIASGCSLISTIGFFWKWNYIRKRNKLKVKND